MYYEIHGAGFPLVLLHGGGSTIHTSFGRILPALALSHRVIAVELQAHGHTGDRDAPVSFEQDAADVAALLQLLEVPRADIFGFSNGGQTALEMGIRYPQQVRKLVIASAFYKRDAVPQAFWDGFSGATLENMPQVYRDAYLKITGSEAGLLNMFNKDVQRMVNFKGWDDDALRAVKAPCLVVQGDRDICTPEHAAAMCRLLPDARLAILPGNHGSYIGEIAAREPNSRVPELFLAIISEFLATPFTT